MCFELSKLVFERLFFFVHAHVLLLSYVLSNAIKTGNIVCA